MNLLFVTDMAPWFARVAGQGARRRTDRDKFYANTRRIDGGCWEWTAGKFRNRTPLGEFNYGAIVVRDSATETKTMVAHRYSWMLHRGPIPTGMLVLHSCDNPSCANPHHLFLGSQKDNMQDMVMKGRKFRTLGSYKVTSKLTAEKVGAYRRRHIAGESVRSLAPEMGMNARSLYEAIHGQTWKHLTAEEDQPCRTPHKRPRLPEMISGS